MVPEFLLVASEHDEVARRFGEFVQAQGRSVCHVDGPAAARLFTVRVGKDVTSVSPSIPMLVRSSAWWHEDASLNADQLFLRAESYAAFWAAASLSSAPVFNRPGPDGAAGQLKYGEIASLFKTGVPSEREVHARSPHFLSENGESIWGEDANYLTAPLSQLPPGVPVRARSLDPKALFEIVTVVANQAFPATTDQRTTDLDLGGKSLAFTRRLNLQFATVTWAVTDKGATAIRLNASPDACEIRYAWEEISAALYQELLS
jgi:hypothetical protein